MEIKDIDREISNITYQIKMVKNILADLPNGEIVCRSSGKYQKLYCHRGSAYEYISKKDVTKINLYSKTRYYKTLLREYEEKLKALMVLRTKFSDYNYTDKLLSDPKYGEMILNAIDEKHIYENLKGKNLGKGDSDKEDFVKRWLLEEYETNPNHPENLTHRTADGKLVRSKSEQLIAMCLQNHGIPYRYEAKLDFGGIAIYPDFTFLNPLTLETKYWEHFGMMDNDKYRNNAFHKLQTYCDNEIYPSIHLITTFETNQNPLDLQTIENIIKSLW